jgi:hypothetical protein
MLQRQGSASSLVPIMVGPGRLWPNAEGAPKGDMPCTHFQAQFPRAPSQLRINRLRCTLINPPVGNCRDTSRIQAVTNAACQMPCLGPSSSLTLPQLVLLRPISHFSAALAEFKPHLCDMHPRLERRTPPFPYLCGMTISSIRSVWTFESAGLAV